MTDDQLRATYNDAYHSLPEMAGAWDAHGAGLRAVFEAGRSAGRSDGIKTTTQELCRRREYVGDGVYYECRRAKGHEGAHDYGWGIGRRIPPGVLSDG